MNDQGYPIISIFIPAYNAASHISSVIERIPLQVWNQVRNVWIVNDGSVDSTKSVLSALEKQYPKIHAIHFSQNRGYGAAVKAGIERCINDGCDYAVCLHADGQYPPEGIGEFVAYMQKKQIDILQGSRLAQGAAAALRGGMPLYKYIAGKILTMIENRVFGLSMTDYHSGFLVYGRQVLDFVPFKRLSPSFDFDLEVIACGCARGLVIAELPIPARYAAERSYLSPVTYGMRILRILVRYLNGYYRRLSWYW